MMTNALRLSIGVAISALLIGCNKAEPAAAKTAEVAVANEAVPTVETAAPAATPAAAGKDELSKDYMLGKWSAMGTCDDTIEFRKDGTITTPMGGGKWSMTGDQLLIEVDGAGKQTPSKIVRVDDNTINVMRSGKPDKQIRC